MRRSCSRVDVGLACVDIRQSPKTDVLVDSVGQSFDMQLMCNSSLVRSTTVCKI